MTGGSEILRTKQRHCDVSSISANPALALFVSRRPWFGRIASKHCNGRYPLVSVAFPSDLKVRRAANSQ